MVHRNKPELSAYAEGQWLGERTIDSLQKLYGENAMKRIYDTGRAAFEMLHSDIRPRDDPDWSELLRGYLSKFD